MRALWGLTLAGSIAVCGPAAAGARDDALDAMLRCAKIADDAARHSCFDAAIPQLKAAAETAPVGATPTPEETAAAEPPPPEDHSAWSLSALNPFGSGAPEAPTKQQMAYQPIGSEILPLTIGVADYTTGPHGYTVTLDNGQVWQNYPRLVDAPPFSASEKNVVTINRAMLGGYNLVLKNRGRPQLYKVVRVK